MALIYFDEGDYSVSGPFGKVELLSKEYALLHFLYRNRDKTFTREHLLDQVWPLEYPGERTVDDHIYRLRKKLSVVPEMNIGTVRGLGYRLSVKESAPAAKPSMTDPELQTAVLHIFQKYHRFGQGKSISTLIAQQEALGIEVDPFYQKYLHFLSGDLSWFINNDDLPSGDRLYWMLILYSMIASPKEGLQLSEKVLSLSCMDPEHHREMYYLNIIDLYAGSGMYNIAKERIEVTRKLLDEDADLESFRIPMAISELLMYIYEGNGTKVKELVETLSQMLEQKPYLREIGRFHYVQGMWHYSQGRMKEASASVEDALEIFRQSGFVPHILLSVRQFLCYMELKPPSQTDKTALGLKAKLLAVFKELDDNQHYTSLKDTCLSKILSLLPSV